MVGRRQRTTIKVMGRHRPEWPSFWAAIDDVVAADLEVQFEHRTARQAASPTSNRPLTRLRRSMQEARALQTGPLAHLERSVLLVLLGRSGVEVRARVGVAQHARDAHPAPAELPNHLRAYFSTSWPKTALVRRPGRPRSDRSSGDDTDRPPNALFNIAPSAPRMWC